MRFLALLAALPLIACGSDGDDTAGIAGTGSGNTRSYQVADFTGISLRGADDVDVRVGPAFAVRAEGDPEVLNYLKIEKVGDTLRIGRRNRSGFDWGSRAARVYVTMPRIAAGAVAGAGDLKIDRVEGGSFAADVAGAGDIDVGALAVETAAFNIAGAGNITAAGTARAVKVSIAGAGDIASPRLRASAADVSIMGSGEVRLEVDGEAKVSIMGSGDVDLGPKARCQVSKMGTGTVRCGN